MKEGNRKEITSDIEKLLAIPASMG